MGNAILDVVLGLVLTYIVLSLLVMKLQEVVDGGILRGRVSNLHQMLLEACGGSEDLKDRVLKNPLVSALYRSDGVKKGLLLPSKGPGSIPPDLFARALLMELAGGEHPSSRYSVPSAFLNELKVGDNVSQKTVLALRGLGAGREISWTEFEAAIATWFGDIGDRADGWFARRALWWSLGMAFFVAAALNVDSFHMATELSTDDKLRDAIADIARRVNNDVAPDPAAVRLAPPARVREDPSLQATMGLTDAIDRLGRARSDRGFATFSTTMVSSGMQTNASDGCWQEPAVQNPAAPQNAPSPAALRQVSVRQVQTSPAAASEAGKKVDSNEWLRILTVLRTRVERTRISQQHASETYVQAFNCLSHLSSWIGTASNFTTEPGTRDLMRDAAVAIESSKSALLALNSKQQAPRSVQQWFKLAPEEFRNCAASGNNRSEFDACMAAALAQAVRLPLLHTGSTNRAQFCNVTQEGRGASGAFCREEFAGSEKLGLPKLYLVPNGSGAERLFRWLAGIFVTALFVALGAPFWFDILGKVARIRAAGDVRDDGEAAKRSRGTAPPPTPGTVGRPDAGSRPPGGGTGPFSDTRNRFEDGLVAADIVRLQQALGVEATSRLDLPTRKAVADFDRSRGRAGTEELSGPLFNEIVGRAAVNTPAAPPTTRLILNQVGAQVQPVARALMTLLDFPGRIAAQESRFTPDLRALVLLYRYKKDTNAPAQKEVSLLVGSRPSQLDEADEALIADILKQPSGALLPRENAPWLDWAIGELGQVERNSPTAANSNPRIIEYLNTAQPGSGAAGDATAWCGAFTAWVLKCHADTLPAADRSRYAPVKQPLVAANWVNWGQSGVMLTAAVPGDIVVFQPDGSSSGHVGFLIDQDPNTGLVWVLGGNQRNGSRVSITSFPVSQVRTVRRA